jgi:hypothetical protein
LFSEDLERIIAETGENPFLMVTDDELLTITNAIKVVI